VEPYARALQAQKESPPNDRGPKDFSETIVAQDGEALLADAGQPPADPAAAAILASRLREQETVWRLAAHLWELQRELEDSESGLTAKERKVLAANDVDKVIASREKPEEPPTQRELRQYRTKLQRAITRVERLRPTPRLDAEEETDLGIPLQTIFEKTQAVEYSMVDGIPKVKKKKTGVVAMTVLGLATLALDVTKGLQSDRQLLTVFWTRVVRPGLRRAAGQAARLARWFTGLLRRGPDTPRGILALWTRRDVALTVIAVAVSSVVYTLTVYDATWGALPDYLSAFAAGFLGKTVVDWSQQFISKSLRVS
jgi:hypothetical protein